MSSDRFASLPRRAPVMLLVIVLAGAAVGIAGTSSHAAAEAPEWQDLDERVRPPAASNPMMAYDEARHELVLFGGSSREHVGTWVRRDGEWARLHPETEPSPRYGAAMVYDSVREEIVLFGGWAATGSGNRTSNETWIWDGANWRLAALTTSPSPRAFAGAAFDRVRGQLVLFGGLTGDGTGQSETFGDTWAWDGSEWRELSPANSPPPHRSAGAAFDAARGEVIIFGGNRSVPPDPCEVREPISNSCLVNVSDPTQERPDSLLSETWAWDGTTWTERSPEHSPGARTNPGVAYDSARDVTVLFGGVDGSGSLTDAWVWDGIDWTEVHPPDRPSSRFGVAMAGDPDSGRVVLFGGHQVTNFARDTWGWDGTNWSLLDHPPTPEPRYYAAHAYDTARDEFLLFGGTGHRRHEDTWIYDDRWNQRLPSSSPPARSAAAAAYDEQREQVVLFGGHAGEEFDDTWVWDGTTWRDVSPATSPPARRNPAMAYDSERSEAVLFGGADVRSQLECLVLCDRVARFDDTWTWDGTAWTEEEPHVSPPPLRSAAMAFDAARGEVILFGGLDGENEFSAETWTWDGETWTHEQPATKPTARSDAAMAYDPLVERVVLFSGLLEGGGRPDVWLWDGSNWTEVDLGEGPSSRLGATLAFHSELGGSLLFGGTGGGPRDDTWLLRLGISESSPSPTPTFTATPTPTEDPVPETTDLAFTARSATSGQFSDEVLFEARLTDSAGDPIEETALTFTLTGEESSRDFTATTDQDGVAAVAPTLQEKPGPHQLTARYEGDEEYSASASTIGFVVDKEDTDTELTVEGRGKNRILKARLSDRDSSSGRIENRTIDFYADGDIIGSGTTDSNGIATLQPPPRYRGGPHTFEARFEGDGYYHLSFDQER